ncbi:hypothetical protein [Planococcus salinus]|uniref:SLC13 family permease n=1 Tax=Planococcus salinus TaxID=1848460 RepID=A0A3M8P7X8_9BACL|nr:hypothetical protein [Planococcus salinus]RNF39767.1 hypothetical protein EEX84_07310 [Planococcus salinus]
MKPIIRPLGTLLMGGLYLLSLFFPIPYVSFGISLLALLVLISYFPYLNRLGKTVITALTVSALLLDLSWEGLQQFFFGLETNLNVLAIFIFVPLLSIPIQRGNYLQYIEVIFSFSIKKTHHLYLFSTVSAVSIGSVMNMGALPILYQLTETESFKDFATLRTKALNRGFVLAFMGSPYFVSIGLVISYFDVTWLQILPIGLVLGILFISIGVLMEKKRALAIPQTFEAPDAAALKKARRKVLELLAIIGALTAAIMIAQSYSPLSVLALIPIASIITSVTWSYAISTKEEFVHDYRSFFSDKLPAMGNELATFIVAGAFGTALLNNGIGEGIMYLLEALNITHVLMLIPLMALFFIIPAMLGVHPLITATILAITLSQASLFDDAHLFVSLGLLYSWMASILISPFSGVNLLMGAITRKNSFEIALKDNLGFGLFMWVVCYAATVLLYFVL